MFIRLTSICLFNLMMAVKTDKFITQYTQFVSKYKTLIVSTKSDISVMINFSKKYKIFLKAIIKMLTNIAKITYSKLQMNE